MKKKLKKIKKLTEKKLQTLLWKECRRVADILYKGQNGTYTCFICGRPINGSNKQLSHLIPKSVCGAFLKYDMRNLKWCCYNDNINLGGNLAEYYRKMLTIHPQEYLDQIYRDKQKITKSYDHYLWQLEEYKKIV